MNIDRNISSTPRIYRVKGLKSGPNYRLLRDLPKDTFEKTKDTKNMADNNNDNLKFRKVKIAFYPEDVAKMEGMTLEERIKFKQQLKAENRYIRLDDEQKPE